MIQARYLDMIKKIYLDMDGVICDFCTPFFTMAKQTGLPITNPLKSYHDTQDQRLFHYAVKQGVFADLPLMDNACLLIDTLQALSERFNFDIEILSSVNCTTPSVARFICEQKRQWLQTNGIHFPANFVDISFQKGEYANYNHLLIDDSEIPIKSFATCGGKVIKHTQVEKTLDQLAKLLKGR